MRSSIGGCVWNRPATPWWRSGFAMYRVAVAGETGIGNGRDAALEGLERIGERLAVADQGGAGGIREVLALPRDGQLQDHRRDRRDDDRRQRAEHAERVVAVVGAAAEDHPELQDVGDGRDRRGDHRGDRADEDVAVLDVGELVREHGADLILRAGTCAAPRSRPRPRAWGCGRSRRRSAAPRGSCRRAASAPWRAAPGRVTIA